MNTSLPNDRPVASTSMPLGTDRPSPRQSWTEQRKYIGLIEAAMTNPEMLYSTVAQFRFGASEKDGSSTGFYARPKAYNSEILNACKALR